MIMTCRLIAGAEIEGIDVHEAAQWRGKRRVYLAPPPRGRLPCCRVLLLVHEPKCVSAPYRMVEPQDCTA
jgi:hypothetical protein